MSDLTNEAASTDAPVNGTNNPIQLPVTATGVRYVIPTYIRGHYTKWSVFSDDLTTAIACDVLFGNSSVSVTYDTDSSVDGSGNITYNAATGSKITNLSGPATWIIPTDPAITHFYVDGSAGSAGILQIVIE